MSGPATLQRISDFLDQARYAQAEALARRALASDPGNIDLAAMISFALMRQAKMAQAEFFARRVVEARPRDAQSVHNLGNILITLGRFADGLPYIEQGLALAPGETQIHLAHAMGLIGLHRYSDAAKALDNGLFNCPDDPRLLNLKAYILQWTGRVEEALPILRRITLADPGNITFAQHLAAMVAYAPGLSEEELLEASECYGGLAQANYGAPHPWTRAQVQEAAARRGPMHIGLISPDLRDHAVSYFIESFIDHRETVGALIFCYSSAFSEDAVSERLKKLTHRWRSVFHVSTDAAAAMIQSDRVDVLIDLAGPTNGNRLDVLARKPAPVQMTYMGFPSTTGLKTVDFRIVDSITDPEGDESLATERLLRLDPCSFSYRPITDPPPVAPLPCGEASPVSFGAFSAVMKFNAPLLSMWARVLRSVPGSRLLLKHFALRDPGVQRDVLARLVAVGIDESLISITPPEPTIRAVLPWYNKVDIALDTFPFNGATTTCDAFLMGVPTVSLRGRTPPARVGRSLLTAVGLPELCADTEDQFVSIAVALANDRKRLAHIRATLRERLVTGALCDGRGFARRMTQLCRRALEQAATS